MTIDIDFWIGLPPRQYIRVLNVAKTIGADILRNTVVELKDGSLVNFVYEVTGLKSFATEVKHAKPMSFHGEKIPVMPLKLIQRSKEAIRRPKDLVHLHQIKQTLELRQRSRRTERNSR